MLQDNFHKNHSTKKLKVNHKNLKSKKLHHHYQKMELLSKKIVSKNCLKNHVKLKKRLKCLLIILRWESSWIKNYLSKIRKRRKEKIKWQYSQMKIIMININFSKLWNQKVKKLSKLILVGKSQMITKILMCLRKS